MTMRYLVARYISDLARNEPKNIGVLLASESGVMAKFIGERDGRIDLRVMRPLVSHTGTYKQWIDYWRYVIAQDAEPEQKLDKVLASSRGNYMTVEGEVVYLPPEIAADPHATLRQLYYLLVEEFPRDVETEGERDLNAKCDEIIRRFDLRRNPHFTESPKVDVTVGGGVIQHIIPSFSWVNGTEVYFQKVSLLAIRPEANQKNVNNAAWIFERLKSDKNDRVLKALVKVTESASGERGAFDPREHLAVLNRLADQVVDVDDEGQVENTFSVLAAHS